MLSTDEKTPLSLHNPHNFCVEGLYCQHLECHSLYAAVLCLWGLYFQFQDYFRLVARCIVHTCAWRRYTMSPAHIIRPNRIMEWVTFELLAVCGGKELNTVLHHHQQTIPTSCMCYVCCINPFVIFQSPGWLPTLPYALLTTCIISCILLS